MLGRDHELQERIVRRLRGDDAVVPEILELTCSRRELRDRGPANATVDAHPHSLLKPRLGRAAG